MSRTFTIANGIAATVAIALDMSLIGVGLLLGAVIITPLLKAVES